MKNLPNFEEFVLNEDKQIKQMKFDNNAISKDLRDFVSKNLPKGYEFSISWLEPFNQSLFGPRNYGIHISINIYSNELRGSLNIDIKYSTAERYDTSNIISTDAKYGINVTGQIVPSSSIAVGKGNIEHKLESVDLDKFVEKFKNKFTDNFIRKNYTTIIN
jgi:hypothetical protein